MIRAGVDWGSSSFRAYRFDEHARVIDSLSSDAGLKSLGAGSGPGNATSPAFSHYLFATIGHWLEPGDEVILSGMVTSKSGWCETAYLPCPAELSDMLTQATRQTIDNVDLIFLPGICQYTPVADVIRGEEIQLLGASQTMPDALMVMPGTHSKWARLVDNQVLGFRTLMTGELYELLAKHSLVGALADDGDDPQAFIDAVRQSYESSVLISELFSCRAGVLLQQLKAGSVRDRLSGLLIGQEIREGLALFPDHQGTIGLIGSDALCNRYQQACECIGVKSVIMSDDAAALGFAQLIKLGK